MRLNEDEMKVRRDRIIEAAFQLFCEYGIEKVSMEQIAKQAGVGKRTMYRYFNKKMDLVIKVLVVQWGILMDDIKVKMDFYSSYLSLTGREQITLWLEAFSKVYEHNRSLILFSYDVKLHVMRNRARFTAEQKDLLILNIREPCVAALDKGKADGTLQFSHDSIEVFYAIWASIRGCIMLAGENSPCNNTYQIVEGTILKALFSE